MAKHEIKFYGSFDSTKIEAQTKKLSSTIEGAFSKSGVKIVDAKSMAFLQGEASNGVRALSNDVKALKGEVLKYDKALKDSTKGSREQNALAKSRLDLTTKIARKEQSLMDLKTKQTRLDQANRSFLGKMMRMSGGDGQIIDVTPGKKKGFFGQVAGKVKGLGQGVGQAAGRVGGALPGVGGMVGAGVAGAGAVAGKGLLLGGLAAAAGAAVVAISRMSAASEAFSQQVPTLLKLAAFGQSRAGGVARQTAVQMGFSASEAYQTQAGLNKALGGTATQKGAEARTANVLTFSRQFGMDPSQVSGAGNQLRAAGGTQAANKQLAAIMNKAVTSGMDASQASAFLGASAGLLAQINENGMMSADSMLAALADLTMTGMSPEQAARTLGGMDAAIKGSKGEAQSFFQLSAIEAGMGGGSILGAQEAVLGGLGGFNMEEITRGMDPAMAKRVSGMYGEMGLGGDQGQKMAGGIIGRLNQIAPDMGSSSSLKFRAATTAKMFGKEGIGEGLKILKVLEKMEKGTASEGDKKIIDELTKDPEKQWRDDVKSILENAPGATARALAASSFAKIDLGAAVSPLMNKLTSWMTKLDSFLAEVMSGKDGGVQMAMSAVENIKKAASFVQETFSNIGKALTEAGKEFMEDPAKFGQKLGKAIIETIDAWWPKIKETFTEVGGILTDSLNKMWNKIKEIMSKLPEFMGGVAEGGRKAERGLPTDDDNRLWKLSAFQKIRSKVQDASGVDIKKSAAEELVTLKKAIVSKDEAGETEAINKFVQAQGGEVANIDAVLGVLREIAGHTKETKTKKENALAEKE